MAPLESQLLSTNYFSWVEYPGTIHYEKL
jgi:hypothetical protein